MCFCVVFKVMKRFVGGGFFVLCGLWRCVLGGDVDGEWCDCYWFVVVV